MMIVNSQEKLYKIIFIIFIFLISFFLHYNFFKNQVKKFLVDIKKNNEHFITILVGRTIIFSALETIILVLLNITINFYILFQFIIVLFITKFFLSLVLSLVIHIKYDSVSNFHEQIIYYCFSGINNKGFSMWLVMFSFILYAGSIFIKKPPIKSKIF